jgi:hypothetical protein
MDRRPADQSWQGRGLGSDLLRDALRRILAAADQIGIRAVLVDAIDDGAAAFYRRYGFEPSSEDGPTLMVLIAAVRSQISPPPQPVRPEPDAGRDSGRADRSLRLISQRQTNELCAAGWRRRWSDVEQQAQGAADIERDGVTHGAKSCDQPLLGDGLDVLAFRVADLVEPRAIWLDLDVGRQASMRGRSRDDDHDAGVALVQLISGNHDGRPAA